MSHYVDYYTTQVGGGGISKVYVGSSYQRGHGIGSFLGGLFRRVLPILARGARTVGKEALRAGVNVLNDVDNRVPLKQAFNSRFKESGQNLKRKALDKIDNLMNGSGYKLGVKNFRPQLPGVHGLVSVTQRRKGIKRKKVKRLATTRKSKKKKKKKGVKNTKSKKTINSRKKRRNKKTQKKPKRKTNAEKNRPILDIFGG